MNDVTRILSAIEQGDPHIAAQLLPLVYDELRKLAAQRLAEEKPGQTLQATALVHDAYLRLVDTEKAQLWDSRGHFFAAAAEAMRRILVEKALRGLRIHPDDLPGEAIDGPLIERDGTKSSAARNQALDVERASFTARSEHVRDQRDAAWRRQQTVGRWGGHPEY